MLNSDQQRIARDLHLGCAKLPYKQLVYNQAGDITTVVNALYAETQRADVAEAKLAAAEEAKQLAQQS